MRRILVVLAGLLLAPVGFAGAQKEGAQPPDEGEGVVVTAAEEPDANAWATDPAGLEQAGFPTVAQALREPGTFAAFPEGSDEAARFRAEMQRRGATNLAHGGREWYPAPAMASGEPTVLESKEAGGSAATGAGDGQPPAQRSTPGFAAPLALAAVGAALALGAAGRWRR